jgi:isochorismate hydrolase
MAVQSFRQIVNASPSSASPVNSTLIIIDAQNEYAEGKLKVTNAASSRKAIANLLQKYRDARGKIVHVVHQTPDGAPVFTPDSKLAEEFDELKPRDGEKVIGKNHPSSFADTDLQEFLGDGAGAKIVLTGYMVSFWMGWVLHRTAGGRIADFSNRRHTFAFPLLQEMQQDWDTTCSSPKTAWVTETSRMSRATI